MRNAHPMPMLGRLINQRCTHRCNNNGCKAPTLGTGGGFFLHTSVVSWHASELSADLFLPLNSASERSDRSSSSDTWAQARAIVMHSTSHLLACGSMKSKRQGVVGAAVGWTGGYVGWWPTVRWSWHAAAANKAMYTSRRHQLWRSVLH